MLDLFHLFDVLDLLDLLDLFDVFGLFSFLELGLQPDGTVVLPGREWMCIDAEHYFNITSLMNDSRCILDMTRLKDTFIFHEVQTTNHKPQIHKPQATTRATH